MIASRKRVLDPNVVRPKILNLPHVTTNEQGLVHLDLKNWNLQFSGNDQVTLDFLEVPTASLHNMGLLNHEEEKIQLQRYIGKDDTLPEAVGGQLQFASSQAIQDLQKQLYNQKSLWERTFRVIGHQKLVTDTISFPPCKIATMDELRVVLNFMLNYAGIYLDLTSDQTLVWTFHADCPIQMLKIGRRITQVLGLVRKDGVVSIFLQKLYENHFVSNWSFVNDQNIEDSNGSWLYLDRKLPLSELKMLLPFHKDTFIWNDLTSNSFQMMMVGFDKMKQTFTGTELTKTLAVIPIQPEKVSLSYKPVFHSWKQMQTGLHSFITLYFHDERGHYFKNVTLSLVLKFRKNTLF